MLITTLTDIDDDTADALGALCEPILAEGDHENGGSIMVYRVTPGAPANADGGVAPGVYAREVRGNYVIAYAFPGGTQASELLDYVATFKR